MLHLWAFWHLPYTNCPLKCHILFAEGLLTEAGLGSVRRPLGGGPWGPSPNVLSGL
jgi:hypothetical protein